MVDHVDNGAHADAALGSTQYALLVLDLGLPQLDGRDVLQRLRQRGDGLAVLVVTARDGLAERVRVLDLGADDYLVKPFALDEFEARVRAQLRRVTSNGNRTCASAACAWTWPGTAYGSTTNHLN